MSTVNALGYLRLKAPDLGAWRSFADNLLGLQLGETATQTVGDGALYLKQDDRSYRLAIEQSEQPGVTFGWEVANPEALAALAARLDEAGVAVKVASDEHAQSRMTRGMIVCDDPAGNTCEIFYGATSDKEAFVSPTGARFATGSMGLGHAFMLVPDAAAFASFYSLLGFRLSDYIEVPSGVATFMHCNARHHSLAFIEVPNLSAMQHLMLEVDDIDVVGRSYDRALASATRIAMTLGRHTNDRMLSYYATSPSGVDVEYGSGGITIDDETWTVQHFNALSYWGHVMAPPLGSSDPGASR